MGKIGHLKKCSHPLFNSRQIAYLCYALVRSVKNMSRMIPALLSSNDINLQLQGIRLAIKTRAYILLPQLIKLTTSFESEIAEAATTAAVDLSEFCLQDAQNSCPEAVIQASIEIVRSLDPGFIQNLYKKLETGNNEEVRSALMVVKHFVNERKAEEILQLLQKHPDPTIRATTVQHLGHIASRVSAEGLSLYIDDPDPRVKANTIDVLGKLGNKFFVKALQKYKNDSNPRVRANALKSLYTLGELDIKEDFSLMLSDSDAAVRASAVWAIGEIGGIATYFLRLLEVVKNDNSEVVRAQLMMVLKKLGQIPELEFLRVTLKEDLKAQLRHSVVRKKNLTISQKPSKFYLELALSGVFTAQTVLTIKLLLDDLIHKEKRFILDLREVEYIDSSGVGLLVNFQKNVKKKDGFLYIYGCNERITELFQLSKVDSILDIFRSIEEIRDFLVLPAERH